MDRVRDREALLTGRSRSPGAERAAYCYAFRAMGGRHELHVWAEERSHADRAAKAAITDVLRIEAKYSRYREDSVTTAINRAAGGAAVAIDEETAALLRFGARCHALSGGRFDLTSGVLRGAWDFTRQPSR
ncbi:MAG TPA: FAD:protein FMN transferase, partial [Casimicrobiaceae bacterium]|nr:FAD:protein FMN transferase [Casimicrobiaceae bacterium]